jgi:hypothetical protein
MCAGPFLWIALAVAVITAAPRETGGTVRCPCARVLLFVFPPPLVGVELGLMCGAAGGLCWSSPPPLGLPLGVIFVRRLAANLKLVQTKWHDKLGVGVTQESHKVPW